MPQRLRRLGSASAAVSAGALVLVLAAPAGEAAAAETCRKGVDPESTVENWKCNLGNLRDALTPKSPAPTPKPTPRKTGENKTKRTTQRPVRAPAKAPRTPSGLPGGGRGAAPSGPAPMTGGDGLKPYSGEAPAGASGLPGVLPTPEIAAGPNAHQNSPGGTAAMPQTRLISPVADSGEDNRQMLLVAAAAGAAGAAGALNLSVAGRALRRRRTTR
ncbi:hypothetical protein [Actinomadura formosensis]|uniref:hypothetical protein n=1 Tax=Actinomadura formosensis TaxID=60706 RepID=UPI000835C7E2|nr:hypothetical protein [Actinomadura formosensis]